MLYIYLIAALLIVVISIAEILTNKETTNTIWFIILALTCVVVGLQFHFY